MNVEPLEEERIAPPTQSVLQRYLSIDPPRKFSVQDLEEEFGSSSKARQFATKATSSRIAVRIERGEYVAIDPSVSIRAWAIPDYQAHLLVLHAALEHLGINHAFACLPAGEETDLLFDWPWLVTPTQESNKASKVSRFTYDYGAIETVEMEALGETFDVPVLSLEETALVLAATGLPREVEAARSLVEGHPPDESLVPAFNYVGLDLGRDNVDVENPHIGFPEVIEHRRQSLGEDLLREGRS